MDGGAPPGNNGPLQLFGDFGLVGGQNVAPNPLQNNQICINFYVEVNPANAKEVVGLLGCPGLVQLVSAPGGGAPGFSSSMTAWPAPSSVTNLPVRGGWVLPGGATAIVVIGATCYLLSVVTPATSSSFPTLGLQALGTLNTTTGYVCMRDNGAGGYVCMVDGPCGYTVQISTNTFAQITSPNFLGSDRIAYIDGWWIFNQPGTQVFYTNYPQYSITFNGTYYALKDANTDLLVTLFENKEQLWLVGERSTEIWYDAGNANFPFQRLVGTIVQSGCKAKHSIARFSTSGQDSLIWFGSSERGDNVIVLTQGFTATVVSNAGFSDEVATYPITSDAIGYVYQEDGHEFYVLTFPTADVTWCFDAQSGELHKRLSYDPYTQTFHRHRSNVFMNFQGMRIVGDYQNGAIYQLTRKAYTDAGWPLLAWRRAPHVWDRGQRGRVFMCDLILDFLPGVGNASGLGSDPVVTLAISRNGGLTFGQRTKKTIGKIGQFSWRLKWRRLGFGRDNVIDLQIIDPVRRDLVGATLKAFSSG